MYSSLRFLCFLYTVLFPYITHTACSNTLATQIITWECKFVHKIIGKKFNGLLCYIILIKAFCTNIYLIEFIIGKNTERKDLFPVTFCIVWRNPIFTKIQMLPLRNLQLTKNSLYLCLNLCFHMTTSHLNK